jgi:predicted Zn-dependent protease
LWREYAYLQQGRYQEAKAMFAIMTQDGTKSEHRTIRYHLAAMRAAYVVNTRQWDSEAARLEVKTDGLEKDAIAGDLLVRGMGAVETGELHKAEKILAEIEALRPANLTPTASATVGMQCHALPAESANYPPAVQAVNIMAKELRALLQMSGGKTDEALQLLKEAAYDEDRMSFDFGPPVVVKPTRELLGEMLLKLDRAQEAQAEFASSLKRAPKRFLSLLGMARAAAKAGDQAAAQEAYATLEKILHRADAEMVELTEVKKGVTKRL